MDSLTLPKLGASNLVITSEAFGFLRKALIENLGKQKAKRFLLRFGRDIGAEKAKELLATTTNVKTLLKQATLIHAALGHVTNVTTIGTSILKSDGTLDTVHGTWYDSFEVALHLTHHSHSEECACFTLSGFASGFLSTIHNQEIFVKEITCRSKKDSQCTFEVNTRKYWEEHGENLAIYDDQKIIDELEFTYDKLLEQKKLLVKVTNYHSKLTESVAQQNDIQKVLKTALNILGIPIFITDMNGTILFKEGTNDDISKLTIKYQSHFQKIENSTILQVSDFNILTTPIYLDQTIFATCSFLYVNNVMDQNDYLFLERLAVAVSLCFLSEKVSFETTERLKITFLDQLLHNQFKDSTELITHSKYIEPKIENDFVTISLKYSSTVNDGNPLDPYQQLLHIAKLLKLCQLPGLVSLKDNHLIIFAYSITNKSILQKKIQQFMNELKKSNNTIKYKAGISNIFNGFENFNSSVIEAEQAMNLPRPDTIIYYASLGFLGPLLENLDLEKLKRTAQNELKELLNPDPKMRELLYTIFIYLKNNGNLKKTGNDLSLSIGGIKYRIEKSEEILGKDLKDSTTTAYLLLLFESLILLNEINFDSSYFDLK